MSWPGWFVPTDLQGDAAAPDHNHSDIWDAFVAGAREGQRYPAATEHDLNRAADGYVKLREIRKA